MNTAFDTLKAAKRLKDAGLEENQAEALVEVIGSTLTENLATKDDLAAVEERLDGKISAVEERLNGKIASVRGDISAVEERLNGKIASVEERLDGKISAVRVDLKWMKAIGGVIVALLVLPLLRELIQAF